MSSASIAFQSRIPVCASYQSTLRPRPHGSHSPSGWKAQQQRFRLLKSSPSGCRRCQGTCAAQKYVGGLRAEGLKFGFVVGRFNELVTRLLLDGAAEAIERHGGEVADEVWVPGSFELPLIAKAMAASGKYDAVLAIGAVVRGATTHYDAVVSAATNGVLNAGLNTGVPVVFGVLTTENMEQALDRAGGKAGNKGFECAVTAIEMADLLRQLKADGKAA